jgi:transposase-like protein
MQTPQRKSRKRRSLSEIAKLIKQLNDSGVTVAEFAVREGVSPASVYRWKRLLRNRGQTQPQKIPVRIVPKLESGAPRLALAEDSGIRLHLPNGIRCSLSQNFDRRALARLLETL